MRCFRLGRKRLGFEGGRRGIEVRGIHVAQHRIGPGRRRLQGPVDRNLQIVVHLLFQTVDALLVENALPDQKHLHAGDGIALGIALALEIGPVEFFVVRKRVRVGPDHVGMDKGRTASGAAMRHGAHESSVAGDGIGSIHFLEVEVGKTADQPRNVSAGGLYLDRHRDGIFVVLDHEDQRKPEIGSGVQRLPEFTFTGGAFAQGDVGNLVAVEFHVFELPVIARGFARRIGMSGVIAADFGTAHGLQNLRPGRRGAGDDIEVGQAPVGRHLPAAGTGVVTRTDRLQQHVIGSGSQGQTERPVAVIRIKPVVAGLQGQGRGHAHGFMPRTRDLEEDLLLAFEHDLPVVHPPGGVHVAVGFDQLFAGETFVGLAGFLAIAFGDSGRLRVSLGGGHPVPLDASVQDAFAL